MAGNSHALLKLIGLFTRIAAIAAGENALLTTRLLNKSRV